VKARGQVTKKRLVKQTLRLDVREINFPLSLNYNINYVLTRIIVFYSLLRLTCSILVCVSGCRQPKQTYAIKCNGYKINDIKVSYIIAACLFS